MRKIIITENQLQYVVDSVGKKKSIQESIYDSEKMYSKEYVNSVTRTAPKYVKKVIKNLPEYDCPNRPGKCVKIPEMIFQYIKGNF
jgi:hypothetical protein